MKWLILASIVAVIMGLALTVGLVMGRKREQRQRALSVITRNKAVGVKENDKDKQLARQRAEISRKLKEAGKEDGKKKDSVSTKNRLQQAGFETTPPARYWIYSALFSLGTFLFLSFATQWPKDSVVFCTLAAFFGAPKFFLNWKIGRRQKKFLTEFPDALDGAVRLLQAGMPMSEAIAMSAREFTGPLKEEMMRICDNQKIGVPIGQAALEMARRMPLTEVHMFATALLIQSETGSSLSEILSNLAEIIRSRFKLKRKIKALSSEAKVSAGIIGALPVIVTLGLHFANPDYISLLYTTPKGKMLAFCALAWMSFGALVMRQMINFRI